MELRENYENYSFSFRRLMLKPGFLTCYCDGAINGMLFKSTVKDEFTTELESLTLTVANVSMHYCVACK